MLLNIIIINDPYDSVIINNNFLASSFHYVRLLLNVISFAFALHIRVINCLLSFSSHYVVSNN